MGTKKKTLIKFTLLMLGLATLSFLIGFVQVLVPEETLIRIVTTIVGENDSPMGFFSLITVILIASMVATFWNFTKILGTKNFIRWPLIIITPFNFGFPITIIYMIWKTVTCKKVEHMSATD